MGDMSSPEDVAEHIYRVRDINWADPNIYRAGIIPICDDGTYRWIGLGVTMFSTNITSIGGSYETTDVDLLDTAVREYNEEVGNNMRNVVDESIYNCYTIKTDYTIQILMPVCNRPYTFKRTEELYTMLWVTTKQLEAMERATNMILPGTYGKTRAFPFSMDFRKLVKPLIYAVDNGIGLKLTRNSDNINRPMRISKKIDNIVITDMDKLEEDSKITGEFIGFVGIVIVSGNINKIGLIRNDRRIYILTLNNVRRIADILIMLKVKILVSTNIDKSWLIKNTALTSKMVRAIESYVDRPLPGYQETRKSFMNRMNGIKGKGVDDLMIKKLELIAEYETLLYKLIQKDQHFFNEKRAYFLDALNVVNNALSLGPMLYSNVRQNLGNAQHNINVTSMISFWINTGVYIQDDKSTIISIPK